jgi:cholest-4-en-3-one 26-monooxygenase
LSTTVVPEGFDPTDPQIYAERVPHEEFLALRSNAPVFWIQQTPEARAGFLDEGYWAVSKHADVSAVSKNNADFSTFENGAIIRFAPDMTREQVELQRVMLINHDAPEHTKLRGIISRLFTPRSINALHDKLEERSREIVQAAAERGTGDFVEDIAAELPLQAIADLLGVPQEDRKKLFDWSNQMLGYDDPDFTGNSDIAAAEILGYAMTMAEERKANPTDDIVTKLIQADVEGEALTSDEFGYFYILLTVAGNETTRNAITHGMKAFFENPDQWELFKKERPESAIDEIIRWATPVTVFQRTALNDVMVGDVEVKKGQRVGLFYASANHDSEVFDNPDAFNIMRDPNPHLAFGGHGAHYCIGANLARMEVGLILNAIADYAPDIHANGEHKRFVSGWINGIKSLPVAYK